MYFDWTPDKTQVGRSQTYCRAPFGNSLKQEWNDTQWFLDLWLLIKCSTFEPCKNNFLILYHIIRVVKVASTFNNFVCCFVFHKSRIPINYNMNMAVYGLMVGVVWAFVWMCWTMVIGTELISININIHNKLELTTQPAELETVDLSNTPLFKYLFR